MHFKTILTDIDARTRRQPAIERVRQLALASSARVELFSCDCLDQQGTGMLFDDRELQRARSEYMSGVEQWLDEQAAGLRKESIDVHIGTAWEAPRYEAILARAKSCDADLIMRAAREHSRLERLLISATDWELIRHARQTVWLVKRPPAGPRTPINVLAAVDPVHSEEQKLGLDKRILETAAAIAGINGGTLHLFHAWHPGAAIAPAMAAGPHVPMPVVRVDADLLDNMRNERRAMLDELRKGRPVDDANVHLAEGSVSSTLEEVVEAEGIDVVVAGAISRGMLERLVIGSTAETILEAVDCDVVVVKPEAAGERGNG